MRPARQGHVLKVAVELPGNALGYIEQVDLWMAHGTRIKSDFLPVGRPTSAARFRIIEFRKLHEVSAVSVAHPNFSESRAGGIESDVRAVGRIVRADLFPGRGNQLGGWEFGM